MRLPSGRDRRAGKEFYAAQIFAEILDDDFVFAENFFHDKANLAVARIRNYHAEISVHRFERGQAQIRVESHDFGHDVANLGKKFSANVLDFICTQAANFFDDRERQREVCRSAAHKERRRDD